MAQLGKPVEIGYISKNLRTGLTNIVAKVRKPDGSVVGPFGLTESAHIDFKGLYTFKFYTNAEVDDIGEYFVSILSPSENNHRAITKVTYEELTIQEFGNIADQIQKIITKAQATDLEIVIGDDQQEISIEIDDI